MRPLTSKPNRFLEISTVPGRSSSGSWKLRPSSPPVSHESCEANTWKAEATASVIMAKKIAATRSENRPMASASSAASGRPVTMPVATAAQFGPMPYSAIAMA
ncbi:hypothetical protein ACVIW2_005326 [Bradyrhizobium huanghuaihaiense]